MMGEQPGGKISVDGSTMKLTILGPHEEDVAIWRDAWNKYLKSADGSQAVKSVDRAMDKAAKPIGYGSPEYQAVLNTPEGSYHLLYLLLQKHHPQLSEKDVVALYDRCVDEHGFGYLERTMADAEGPRSDLWHFQRMTL